MLVSRWQAPHVPDSKQIKLLFEAEGLDPQEERIRSGEEIKDHRHPFDEIRTVVSGELLMNVAGNQLLLRPGDRIIIPSNTRHSKKAQGTEDCLCVIANRVS